MVTGLLALAIHFTLVTVHATPFVPGKNKLYYVARSYASTFFHQSWLLFVPPPTTNYTLFATYESNGIQKKEIFNDLVAQHQSNRLTGHEALVVAFSNIIYYFEKSTILQAPVNGPVTNDVNFKMLGHAATRYLQHKYNTSIEHVKLILVAEDTETKKQRIYFN
jgi:hypothetical protein